MDRHSLPFLVGISSLQIGAKVNTMFRNGAIQEETVCGRICTWSSPVEDVCLFIMEPQRKTGTGDAR
jgi:hypothetical protein